MSAKICPECGSDDETGWNPDAVQGGNFVEPEEDFDYQRTVERETGKNGIKLLQIIVIFILIFLMIIYVFPSLIS